MMNKKNIYNQLIQFRKSHTFQEGLSNPSVTEHDGDFVDPWEQWQNNLDADIMVIGQEFSDLATYINIEGKVERYKDKFEYPSNANLREFLKMIGYDPGHPLNKTNASLFITNCVMGLKDGSMSANFRDKWMTESRKLFLKPLVHLIQPKAIICIGSKSTHSVFRIFGQKDKALKTLIQESPFEFDNTLVFPVYHTGGLGLANRSKDKQLDDWAKIGRVLKSRGIF